MRANKKYLFTAAAVTVLSLASLTGCGNKAEKNEPSFKDGTYTKVAAEAENGFTYEMTMKVADGKITEINWDATDENGNSKKKLAMDGEYVMTENGPNWAEQSEALAQYVIDHQSLDGLTTTEDGKTDAVSGVSIKVNSFIEFVEDCMGQASAK